MIRVLVVDDDALVRSSLSMILASATDLDVVAEAADGRDAVERARAHRPDVVLMDVRMPVMDGIAATAEVRRAVPGTQVCMLTTFGLDSYVVDALHAGASGFLLKDTPPLEIIAAVRTVAAGEAMLSPRATRTLLDRFTEREPADARTRAAEAAASLAKLTPREREVAGMVGDGASNAEIARTLFMSETTVKTHVGRLFTKLDVDNRVKVALVVRDARGSTDPTPQDSH